MVLTLGDRFPKREKFDEKVRDIRERSGESTRKSGARFVELFLSIGY